MFTIVIIKFILKYTLPKKSHSIQLRTYLNTTTSVSKYFN